MIDKKEFLATYNMSEEEFEEAQISWEELTAIYEDYREKEGHLRDLGKEFLDEYLYDIEKAGIHSYRYRTKEPGHLLEKVIRKRRENMGKFARLDHTNYHKFITDLIGIRVFFLYREDWIYFHKYLTSVFENKPEQYVEHRIEDFDDDINHYYIAERPKVYKRSGDSKIFDGNLIEIRADGIYRSLHYIVKYKGYYVEIQGRTLFEEGWSEIDHDIVYPYYKNDEMLTDFSKLLNRLSGMADEMSSYFRRLKQEREEND
ncbi:MAG: GTP pyrophosphokinase [Bariatricus sp.]|nr:GTP pyrophosphokinase [Bariatricus sp.]